MIEQLLSFKDRIKQIYTNIKTGIKNIISDILSIINNHLDDSGIYYIIIISIILLSLAIPYSVIFFSFSLCVVVYLCRLLKQYFYFKVEQYYLNQIDLNLLGFDQRGQNVLDKRSVQTLLSEFIENVFTQEVLFYRGFNPNEYINSVVEKELLDELLDRINRSMSIYLRKKISIYFGENNIDIIIGRLCFNIVSIYIANHNKTIYKK